MVLQAGSKDHPVRTIWGFLDGVTSTVELSGYCDLPNGTLIDYSDTFVPKDVSMKDTYLALKRSISIEFFSEPDFHY